MVKCPTKIAPSMLACDFTRMGEELAAVEKAAADYVHWDVMDGNFVPNISFGAPVIAAARPLTKLQFDVHLMVTDALRFVADFAKAGADIITVHIEAEKDALVTLKEIKKLGKKAGISLNPETSHESLSDEILKIADLVLVMCVKPGFGGQIHIPQDEKIRALSARLAVLNPNVEIEVDGGINETTALSAAQAGASVFVAGSAVFKNSPSDYEAAIAGIRNAAEKGACDRA